MRARRGASDKPSYVLGNLHVPGFHLPGGFDESRRDAVKFRGDKKDGCGDVNKCSAAGDRGGASATEWTAAILVLRSAYRWASFL